MFKMIIGVLLCGSVSQAHHMRSVQKENAAQRYNSNSMPVLDSEKDEARDLHFYKRGGRCLILVERDNMAKGLEKVEPDCLIFW